MKTWMSGMAACIAATTLAACSGGGSGGGGGSGAKYTVGGAVTGLAASGLVLQLNGASNLTLDTNRAFDFVDPVSTNASYSVTVLTQPAGQYCSVENGIGTIPGAKVVNVSVTCATSNASTLAYDGFNYQFDQSLVGLDGGLGWSGAWRPVGGFDVADVSLGTLSGSIVAGLNYTDSASHRLVTTDGAWKTNATVFFGQARRATSSSFGTAGTTRWISFLVKQPPGGLVPVSPALNYATATLGTGYTYFSPALAGGPGLYVSDGAYAAVGPFYGTGGAAVALPATSWYEGITGLVVLRIEFNASTGSNDTMSLWLNPVLGTDPGTPLLTTSTANFGSVLSGVTLSWGDYRAFTFDEVRVGTDYAAVTPYR